ncbi:MAG: hypothetical protein JSS29_18580 [Proteobacteria bacterium]|nr:hypothetical protein [Pseudomonadota bacterium]
MNTVAIPQPYESPRTGHGVFLALTALVWVGVLSGFGTDSYHHILKNGLDYPPIVHVHAVVFVSFLLIFTTQVILVRTGRLATHRRLGVAGAVLIGVMLVLGPATAIHVDAHRYVATGRTPEFLAVQLSDILAFGTLAGAALWLRTRPELHKRLMMLALIYISDAGFARLINAGPSAYLGEGFWGDMAALYFGSDLLMLGLGAYDLITRRSLYPAYVAAMLWVVALQLTARAGLYSPAWKAFSLQLIGHPAS